MTNIAFLWLITLPIVASPFIYLAGRLQIRIDERTGLLKNGKHDLAAASRPSPFSLPTQPSLSKWLAILVLAGAWVAFALAVQQFAASGTIRVDIEAIPLRLDGLSLLLAITALGLGTLVTLFSVPYIRGEAGEEKYYAMLVAMIGVMIALGCAADLFNLWVWFEAMAVTSYLLVVFYREQPASLEAGVKYVVQSATGSVLVLIGIALVLSQTGTLNLEQIQRSAGSSPILLAAGALFVVGFGVKTALVPFHTWLPDAHTQAPSGISAMLSGVVIEAGLIAMLRSLGSITGIGSSAIYPAATWGGLLMAFGAINMLLGNLMALRQKQVKRLLAYSSLSHVGYMILGLGIALYAGQQAGAQGGMFHLLNHGIMKGLAFLAAGALLYAISGMGTPTGLGHHHGPLTIADLNGAATRYPLAALALSLAVLGLGGLPPLSGFMSKWQIFVAGFATHNLVIGLLVVFAALNSVLSLAYYAPLVNAVYRKSPSVAVQNGAPIPFSMNIPLAIMSALVILLGLWPALVQWLTGPAAKAILLAFGQ